MVLVRGQTLSEEILEAFARSLGPIWTFTYATKNRTGLSAATSAVYRYSNRAADGTLIGDDQPTMVTLKVNQNWHTDSTYTRPGAAFSIFAGNVIPPEGGNTEFCDMRIAYDAMDDALKERLHGINAYHSVAYSNRRVTGKILADGDMALTPVRRLIVHRHVTGRHALCIGGHVGRMDGMSDAECESLLTPLNAIATAPARVYSHQWQSGDVLLWDNRCTMHRATYYDSSRYEREMWITRIADESDEVNCGEIP
jgi:alpha-ketoglutarate-dependent taurine dioxygenase